MSNQGKQRNESIAGEGDWFAVPLREGGGYGVGLIARADGEGIAFGYFFGPKFRQVPTIADVEGRHYRPADAVKAGLFSVLWLTNKKWPTLGRTPTWKSQDWPLPALVNFNEINKEITLVEYDPKDLSQAIKFSKASIKEAKGLPRDGFSGPGAIEIVLTELLNGRSVWDPIRDMS